MICCSIDHSIRLLVDPVRRSPRRSFNSGPNSSSGRSTDPDLDRLFDYSVAQSPWYYYGSPESIAASPWYHYRSPWYYYGSSRHRRIWSHTANTRFSQPQPHTVEAQGRVTPRSSLSSQIENYKEEHTHAAHACSWCTGGMTLTHLQRSCLKTTRLSRMSLKWKICSQSSFPFLYARAKACVSFADLSYTQSKARTNDGFHQLWRSRVLYLVDDR